MDDAPRPSPEHMAELARRGAEIRREAERLVEGLFRAIADDPALEPGAARDVADYLARRERGARTAKVVDGDDTG